VQYRQLLKHEKFTGYVLYDIQEKIGEVADQITLLAAWKYR